jgi:pilus assembly protein Flp/PilA
MYAGDMNDVGAGRADDRGASLVEYALLVALIAMVCVVAIVFLGTATDGSFSRAGSMVLES